VLVRECYGCHSSKAGNVRGGLRLDTKERMLLGGATGPAVVPGDLEESWLYNAMTHQDFVMPPKRKLPQAFSMISSFGLKWAHPIPRVLFRKMYRRQSLLMILKSEVRILGLPAAQKAGVPTVNE